VKYPHEASKTTFGVSKNIEERNKWENALKTVLKKVTEFVLHIFR